MYLTVSKRFEFSSSRRLAVGGWSDEKNRAMFGPESRARHGTGRNYVAHLAFHGPVDDATGMMINISAIKHAVTSMLEKRYDHRFLNLDTSPFDTLVPTPENVAARLLGDSEALFIGQSAQPVTCHLTDTPEREAVAFQDGSIESHYWLSFSAARTTMSPQLSDEENRRLFGAAASPAGHGHNYRLRVTLKGKPDPVSGLLTAYDEITGALADLHAELDHKNLNHEVPGLNRMPVTTESLARYLFTRLEGTVPVTGVRLYEMENFYAEYRGSGYFRLGWSCRLDAAHRLHSPRLSDEQNRALYGKCNNLHGHGHSYLVEAVIDGTFDERSGTLYNLVDLQNALRQALAPWQDRHLDLETDDFKNQPSTGERIIETLWPKLDRQLDGRLSCLRLWETANNLFTLKKI